ncbi:hypothetical protein ACOME3_004492 [Neoechinorhynchus agilis]
MHQLPSLASVRTKQRTPAINGRGPSAKDKIFIDGIMPTIDLRQHLEARISKCLDSLMAAINCNLSCVDSFTAASSQALKFRSRKTNITDIEIVSLATDISTDDKKAYVRMVIGEQTNVGSEMASLMKIAFQNGPEIAVMVCKWEDRSSYDSWDSLRKQNQLKVASIFPIILSICLTISSFLQLKP